ncbi:PREDICTED: insulin-induced gene 1 protein, partial [Condylura cristata]|uniref:insulin-induced gene 1 protein n=1 Tax=Condylura cristata TaxID=143302 RepID=UPI00064366E1
GGGPGRRATSWHHHLVPRSLVLFSVGVVLALVLNLLQVQRNVTLFPEEVIATVFSSAWWVPPCCGTAAAVVGLLYPCIDSRLGEPHKFKREWASVMRCVAVFVGINHASAKLDFANNVQLSLTLAALSLGLWWTFDRSRSGLGLGITVAFLATLITQLLVYNGVYQYASPDFLYIRSWLPCIFFSGGVTVGNIGRQLAMVGVAGRPRAPAGLSCPPQGGRGVRREHLFRGAVARSGPQRPSRWQPRRVARGRRRGSRKGGDAGGPLDGALKARGVGGGDLSVSSDSDSSQASANLGAQPMLWPAWVYCTRYSDRPSSGERRSLPTLGSAGDGDGLQSPGGKALLPGISWAAGKEAGGRELRREPGGARVFVFGG